MTMGAIPRKATERFSRARPWAVPVSFSGPVRAARKPEDDPMSRVCELTGKGPMTGNNVSHANNKTKRRFLPNLNQVTLQSETLNRGIKMRISASALRSVDHRGGLDKFLEKARDEELSPRVLKVKREIAKAAASA